MEADEVGVDVLTAERTTGRDDGVPAPRDTSRDTSGRCTCAHHAPTPGRVPVGVVGGHPLTVAGIASAMSGSFEVVTGRSLPARGAVLADLTCSGCSPSAEELAELVQHRSVVLLVGVGQVGLAEEALASGALGAVGDWEPVSELRLALRSAALGESWVSPAVDVAGARVREVRSLLSGQEREVLRLYGADLPVKSVARRMGITVGTAKEYLKRLRSKLAARGVAVGTKVDLRVLAEELGLLSPQSPCGTAPTASALAPGGDLRERAS